MKENVLIVGAGIGGLATALRLATRGYNVHLVEKNSKAGGRLNQIKKDGFTFDVGPSFFSMSYEFEELARDCNMKLPFEYFALDPLYSVSFSNSAKTWFLYSDIKKMAEQFKDIEPDFEKKMRKYLKKSGKIFDDTVDIVIKNNFDSVFHYLLTLLRVNPVHLPVLVRSFWKQVSMNFSSTEAREIISLVSFFLGRTPFDTMAVYTLLSYTEFCHDGYYNVKGGMYRIVEGFVSELGRKGVSITYNTEITGFHNDGNRLIHLIDSEGRKWQADIFVINADAALFRGKILGRRSFSEEKMKRMNWTMGYLTFYIGVNCRLDDVNHHNYFLGSNYREYAGSIVNSPDSPEKPYYYVNVISRHNPECAPEGCEALFFVCPVPNLLFKEKWNDKESIVDSILADFEKRINKEIMSHIVSRTIFTPEDWKEQYNLYMGSGLGLSHTMSQIGGFRPKNKDEKFRNLFYVGASTVPGAGLPMA
ncbi:MAG TPA: phytoene desaturase family protein, partial [Bacteroidales bacterium]|nr:phytoene desaturase family protein [Bacteroidales bacterium]